MLAALKTCGEYDSTYRVAHPVAEMDTGVAESNAGERRSKPVTLEFLAEVNH